MEKFMATWTSRPPACGRKAVNWLKTTARMRET